MNPVFYGAQASFEDVYPTASFAELIRLGLALANKVLTLRAWLTGATPAAGTGHAAR